MTLFESLSYILNYKTSSEFGDPSQRTEEHVNDFFDKRKLVTLLPTTRGHPGVTIPGAPTGSQISNLTHDFSSLCVPSSTSSGLSGR